jgi:hypothetical protein
MEIKE